VRAGRRLAVVARRVIRRRAPRQLQVVPAALGRAVLHPAILVVLVVPRRGPPRPGQWCAATASPALDQWRARESLAAVGIAALAANDEAPFAEFLAAACADEC
jgi:hypothetical protein